MSFFNAKAPFYTQVILINISCRIGNVNNGTLFVSVNRKGGKYKKAGGKTFLN
jgi:hypothetical protein